LAVLRYCRVLPAGVWIQSLGDRLDYRVKYQRGFEAVMCAVPTIAIHGFFKGHVRAYLLGTADGVQGQQTQAARSGTRRQIFSVTGSARKAKDKKRARPSSLISRI
jgi:hypothetical protein